MHSPMRGLVPFRDSGRSWHWQLLVFSNVAQSFPDAMFMKTSVVFTNIASGKDCATVPLSPRTFGHVDVRDAISVFV